MKYYRKPLVFQNHVVTRKMRDHTRRKDSAGGLDNLKMIEGKRIKKEL